MSNATDQKSPMAYRLAVRHYLEQMKHDWKISIPALLLTGTGTIFVLFVPPLILAKLLSRFSQHGQLAFSDVMPYILLIGGSWMLGEAIWRLAMYFTNRADAQGMKRLYLQAMEALLQKDQSFFNDNFAGSLTKRLSGYARQYEQFVDTLVFNVSPNLIPIIFASFILWRYSPWLVFILLGMTSLTFVLIYPFIKRRQKLVNAREDSNTTLTGHVADVISNSAAVRSFAKESREYAKHARNVEDYISKARKSWDYHNQVISLITSPMYVMTNVIGITVALLAIKGSLSIEAVLVTFAYFATGTRAVWEFNQIYRNIETSLSEAALFTQLLLEEPTIKDQPHAVTLHAKEGMINFDKINFRYQENAKEDLFHDFSLTIKPGEKVGLVGRSGGGKTSITKLLLRFMDIDSGAITIDGQDIASVTQKSLREAISYVPQEPLLFHRSLADNIRYGHPGATDKEVVTAAKLAHADMFIDKLPLGYETLVGERGVKLSGGQRQRVAIARAILKDAPILLLDEATSALDSESEKYIQQALWELMAGKTAIVIAHRLSTIQRLDRIVVLEEGRVVEEGSHKELLAQNGTYAGLWAHQSGGFLDE